MPPKACNVEVIGVTRPDTPHQIRKLIRTGEVPRGLRLTLGICVTPTSVRDSGRDGDRMNGAPPLHCVPELLREVRRAHFNSAVVFDLRRSRIDQIGAHLQTAVYWAIQGNMGNLQLMSTAAQQEEMLYFLPYLQRSYPHFRVSPCPEEGPTCIFRKAVDPSRTTGEICIYRVRTLLRQLSTAA